LFHNALTFHTAKRREMLTAALRDGEYDVHRAKGDKIKQEASDGIELTWTSLSSEKVLLLISTLNSHVVSQAAPTGSKYAKPESDTASDNEGKSKTMRSKKSLRNKSVRCFGFEHFLIILQTLQRDDNVSDSESDMETQRHSKNAKKMIKKKKNVDDDSEDDDAGVADFRINTKDQRFTAIYENPLYNIDPTNTSYKRTDGTQVGVSLIFFYFLL
jgi:hypothetical protein